MGNLLTYFWSYFLGTESDSENEQAVTDSEDEVDYQNVVDQDESLINRLISSGCMKGGVECDVDDDQVEEVLDPASTVDFNMRGLKSKFNFSSS